MFSKYSLKQSVGWIMAVVGIGCYVVGYISRLNYPHAFWPEIFIKIADVLVIGVVVGYLTGIAQWAGIFKKEVRDIVYGDDFLKRRNDIEEIWYKVTKRMFKFKFSAIHRDLLDALRHTLPGDDDISYYEDYDADTRVEWVDKENGIIKTIDTIAMDIVTESDKEFSYPIKSWTIANDDNSVHHSLEVYVDDILLENLDTDIQRVGNEMVATTQIPLKGKKRYFLKYTREKTYDINQDFYIAYRAKYVTKNLTVSLELPDDVKALFI